MDDLEYDFQWAYFDRYRSYGVLVFEKNLWTREHRLPHVPCGLSTVNIKSAWSKQDFQVVLDYLWQKIRRLVEKSILLHAWCVTLSDGCLSGMQNITSMMDLDCSDAKVD